MRQRHQEFEPRTAPREDKRQANEALGRSFCKTLAEPVTNSDSSAKRKLNIQHASGLVDLMFSLHKGDLLNTSALKARLDGKQPKRRIDVEVVTNKAHGRAVGEVRIIDRAQGMSASTLKDALDEIGGDKVALSGGVPGRNLFGRGLSDFLRAHSDAHVWTFDGKELTVATGEWGSNGRWRIKMDTESSPPSAAVSQTPLQASTAGTAVSCVIRERQRCHIPDHPNIIERLRNFYMLRLIASDPNIDLVLRQFRTAPVPFEDRIQYDFPVGEVVDVATHSLRIQRSTIVTQPIRIDLLLVRSEKKLRGLETDRDSRENGLLLIDDLDAVYDLTFADDDYERADFLRHLFGVIRIHGLRGILERYLNSPDFPTSPLRVDRDGFNTAHEFSRELLDFLSGILRPYYEHERQRAQIKDKDKLSTESKKRIDDALKHLNKYFNEITGRTGTGGGTETDIPPEPTASAAFLPDAVKLTAGRPRHVLLLVREDVAKDKGEVCASGTDGISVQPDTEEINAESCPRKEHPKWRSRYLSFRFVVSSDIVGQRGAVTALVDAIGEPSLLEAKLDILDVLTEPEITPPETMEFRPAVSLGRPGRRNNLVLYVNTSAIALGHWIKFRITDRVGDVVLLDSKAQRCDEVEVKLDHLHQVAGQSVAKVLVPWNGTAWNQHASVTAEIKIIGADPILAEARVRLDEPDPNEGGFFKDVRYTELDDQVPSQYAAGTISVNTGDPLNRVVFGDNQTEFDRRLPTDPLAQQRLASLLLEEASFRALEELHLDNKLPLPSNREVASVHRGVDAYKFKSAVDVFKAIVK